jgi:hypothetical protein
VYARGDEAELSVSSTRALARFGLESPSRHGASMRCLSFSIVLVSLTSATVLTAQPTLRPALSGRATSVVTLTVPRDPAAPNAPPAAASTEPPITIKLDYGQPHLRGRSLHTAKDSLVPYDMPWRTGANDPTTLTTGIDLVVGGAMVPKGTYVLYTIPTRGDWKLIIQKSAGQTAEYDPAHDVARVDLKRRTLAEPVESLTMWLIPSTAPGKAQGELRIAWGTSLLSTTWSAK